MWGIPHSSVFFIRSSWTVKRRRKKTNSFLEFSQSLSSSSPCATGKKIVISDSTVTFLPISGPPTCQERPKYSVVLMKKICSSRRPEFLTSGLTSSLRLIMFQVAFEKCHLVFLKGLLSPGLAVSSVRSLILSPESPSTVVCHPSVTSCVLPSYFSFSSFLPFISCSLTWIFLLLAFLLVKM